MVMFRDPCAFTCSMKQKRQASSEAVNDQLLDSCFCHTNQRADSSPVNLLISIQKALNWGQTYNLTS